MGVAWAASDFCWMEKLPWTARVNVVKAELRIDRFVVVAKEEVNYDCDGWIEKKLEGQKETCNGLAEML